MKFHRMGGGLFAAASPGVLAVDGDATIITPPPPVGTASMHVVEFYRDPTHPAEPIIQRRAGTTAATVTVYYNFTGTAPTQPQAKITKSGSTVIDWINLAGVVNHTTDGSGTVAGVPQGVGYLLHIRDGLKPTDVNCISDATITFGIGVIVVLTGTSNMEAILSGGATTSVVPGSALTEANYYTGTPVHGAVFDEFGWHAPNAATNYGPFSGSSLALLRIMTAALKTLYTTDVPVGIVEWTAVPATGLAAFTGPTGAQYVSMIGANGTASGGIGMGSPRNYYGGDFEIILAHHGEADVADSSTIYQQRLTAFYASMLAYVQPFGRGVNNLYYGLCLPGGYSSPATMENIRLTVQNYVKTVQPTQPHVDIACDCLDLANDGTVLNTSAGELRAMHRLIQGALQFLGCSTIGASGPKLGSPSLSGLVATFSVVHDGGTALELQSGGAITGFSANTAADFSGSTVTPTAALANSNTQIALTFPGGTTFPVYVKYLAGGNPSLVNPVFDNANYPDGTSGTDIEAVGFPLQPTGGSVTVAAAPAGLSATIQWQDGTQTVYSSASATDMGDYTDPAGLFVQGSLLATDATRPGFRVWFRSNKSGSTGYFPYDSVIFEYGDTFTYPNVNLPPYTATIRRSSTVLNTTTLPTNDNNTGHYWAARWRWQSAPFPRNRMTRQQIVTAKLAPNGWNTAFTPTVPVQATQTYTVMGLAGMTADQGQPGGRAEIGFYTQQIQNWLMTGDPNMLSTMFEQVEASGTWQFHLRNPTDHNVLDLQAYPLATITGNPGAANRVNRPAVNTFKGSSFGPDGGHRPALAFIPFLLSGDPYYIEEQQFSMLYGKLEFTGAGRGQGGGRYYAWPLRDVLHCMMMTPTAAPGWFQNKANMQLALNYHSDFVNDWIAGTAEPGGNLHAQHLAAAAMLHVCSPGGARSYVDDPPVAGTYIVPWQEAYMDMSHAFAVIWGFTQFTAPFLWHLESNLFRCNGTSGWPRAYGAMYEQPFMWGTYITAALDATTPTPLIAVGNTIGCPTGNFEIILENEHMLVNVASPTSLQAVTRGYNGTTAHTHIVNKELYLTTIYPTFAAMFTGTNLIWTYGRINYRDSSHPAGVSKPLTFVAGDPTGNNKLPWNGGGLSGSDYTGSHYYSIVIAAGVDPSVYPAGKLAEIQSALAWFNTAIPEAQTRTGDKVPFTWNILPWV